MLFQFKAYIFACAAQEADDACSEEYGDDARQEYTVKDASSTDGEDQRL